MGVKITYTEFHRVFPTTARDFCLRRTLAETADTVGPVVCLSHERHYIVVGWVVAEGT